MIERYATIIKPEYKEFFEKNRKNLFFVSYPDGEAVTKEIQSLELGDLCLIDSPGQNDANYLESGLSDTNINIMITEQIRRLLCPQQTDEFQKI